MIGNVQVFTKPAWARTMVMVVIADGKQAFLMKRPGDRPAAKPAVFTQDIDQAWRIGDCWRTHSSVLPNHGGLSAEWLGNGLAQEFGITNYLLLEVAE